MKMSEIKELTIKELQSRRHELRQEAFNLRIQQQSGQLERPHLLHTIRRDVARIETAINQKRSTATTEA
ncbi:MAG: 50S ribosomal protein L29 [Chthoniobacterales bacterium]